MVYNPKGSIFLRRIQVLLSSTGLKGGYVGDYVTPFVEGLGSKLLAGGVITCGCGSGIAHLIPCV